MSPPPLVAFQPKSLQSTFVFDKPVGNYFTPSSDIQIISLGVYDVQGDGLSSSHAVGIFDFMGASVTPTPNTPLVSVTIPAGNPPAGSKFVQNDFNNEGTWFITLATPLTLNAGTEYAIVGDNFGAELISFGLPTNYNIGQDLTFNGSVFYLDPSTSITDTNVGVSGNTRVFLGPNFEYNLL